MERHITFWCQKIFDNWGNATTQDYAMAVAWIVVVGFLISKLSSYALR